MHVCFVFAHIRAYAIRPYTCSVEFLTMLVCVLVSFSLTSGRMRYAPTLVRILSRLNTINHYTCSVEFRDLWGCVSIPFSPTSGRMRYAPTLVRLLSRLNTLHHYTGLGDVGAGWGLCTMCNRFEMNKYTLHSWVDGRNLVKIASTNWGKIAPFDANKFNNVCTTSRI